MHRIPEHTTSNHKMQEATNNTDAQKKQYTPAGSYTPALFFLSVLARKTKARVKML